MLDKGKGLKVTVGNEEVADLVAEGGDKSKNPRGVSRQER